MLLYINLMGNISRIYNGMFREYLCEYTGTVDHNINRLDCGGIGGGYWEFASEEDDWGFVYVGF